MGYDVRLPQRKLSNTKTKPNIILTWNLTKTTNSHNFQELNGDIKINKVKISLEFDLTSLYLPIIETKIKMLENNGILKLVSENNTTFYIT